MNITIYQILAFIGAVAGMAIVFGLGFLEGRRAVREACEQYADDASHQAEQLRATLDKVRYEFGISRQNAGQAIEDLTDERDRAVSEAATLRLRLTTAKERIAELTPLTLTAEDIVSLRIVNKQLLVAAQTYSGLNLLDQARFASTASERLGLVIDRIAEAVPSDVEPQERAA